MCYRLIDLWQGFRERCQKSEKKLKRSIQKDGSKESQVNDGAAKKRTAQGKWLAPWPLVVHDMVDDQEESEGRSESEFDNDESSQSRSIKGDVDDQVPMDEEVEAHPKHKSNAVKRSIPRAPLRRACKCKANRDPNFSYNQESDKSTDVKEDSDVQAPVDEAVEDDSYPVPKKKCKCTVNWDAAFFKRLKFGPGPNDRGVWRYVL